MWSRKKSAASYPIADAAGRAMAEHHAIAAMSADGVITDANQHYASLMGRERSQLMGMRHDRVIAQAPNNDHGDALWRRLRQGEVASVDYSIKVNGAERWIEGFYSPVRDQSGSITGVVELALDITERRTRAIENTQTLQALSRTQATIEFDPTGVILGANENFLNAMGYRLDEIVGKHHRMFLVEADANSADYASFWTTLAAGEFSAGEFKRIGKSGAEVWIQASYNPVFGPDGKVVKVVKYAADITDRITSVKVIARALHALAEGDLSAHVDGVGADFDAAKASFNATMERLRELIGSIKTLSQAMSRATSSIVNSSVDLSARSESQASAIEETAAAMDEISASVRRNVQSARSADQAAAEAAERSTRGGDVVQEAIGAMGQIEEGSAKISDIISVIDGIAFQTNLLALNAAVEAARAGDAGKGFAVVASEVRTLAQRSSEAAKDISELIQSSTALVANGAKHVRGAGDALTDINSAVDSVVAQINEITAASTNQAESVSEVSNAITDMDKTTSANAAIAEESASNAKLLAQQAESLTMLIAFFKNAEAGALRSAA